MPLVTLDPDMSVEDLNEVISVLAGTLTSNFQVNTKRMQEERNEKGVSISNRAGKCSAWFNSILSSKSITLKTLCTVAALFEVDPLFLLQEPLGSRAIGDD